jgi:hypothetical protein
VLLEAGGCAAWAEGHPTPDPFYVDQAKATILQLEALDVFNQCEIRYFKQIDQYFMFGINIA